MNKLDDATIKRARRRCVAADDEIVNHQRRIIFAAFGQREHDDGEVVNLRETSGSNENTLIPSLRSGEFRDSILSFPIHPTQRWRA